MWRAIRGRWDEEGTLERLKARGIDRLTSVQ
jgi:hypothetical protein